MSKIEIPGLPSEDKPLTLDPVDTPSEESKYEAPGTLIEELDPVLEAATLSQPEIPPEPQDERQKNDPPTTDALDSTNTTPSLFAPGSRPRPASSPPGSWPSWGAWPQ